MPVAGQPQGGFSGSTGWGNSYSGPTSGGQTTGGTSGTISSIGMTTAQELAIARGQLNAPVVPAGYVSSGTGPAPKEQVSQAGSQGGGQSAISQGGGQNAPEAPKQTLAEAQAQAAGTTYGTQAAVGHQQVIQPSAQNLYAGYGPPVVHTTTGGYYQPGKTTEEPGTWVPGHDVAIPQNTQSASWSNIVGYKMEDGKEVPITGNWEYRNIGAMKTNAPYYQTAGAKVGVYEKGPSEEYYSRYPGQVNAQPDIYISTPKDFVGYEYGNLTPGEARQLQIWEKVGFSNIARTGPSTLTSDEKQQRLDNINRAILFQPQSEVMPGVMMGSASEWALTEDTRIIGEMERNLPFILANATPESRYAFMQYYNALREQATTLREQQVISKQFKTIQEELTPKTFAPLPPNATLGAKIQRQTEIYNENQRLLAAGTKYEPFLKQHADSESFGKFGSNLEKQRINQGLELHNLMDNVALSRQQDALQDTRQAKEAAQFSTTTMKLVSSHDAAQGVLMGLGVPSEAARILSAKYPTTTTPYDAYKSGEQKLAEGKGYGSLTGLEQAAYGYKHGAGRLLDMGQNTVETGLNVANPIQMMKTAWDMQHEYTPEQIRAQPLNYAGEMWTRGTGGTWWQENPEKVVDAGIVLSSMGGAGAAVGALGYTFKLGGQAATVIGGLPVISTITPVVTALGGVAGAVGGAAGSVVAFPVIKTAAFAIGGVGLTGLAISPEPMRAYSRWSAAGGTLGITGPSRLPGQPVDAPPPTVMETLGSIGQYYNPAGTLGDITVAGGLLTLHEISAARPVEVYYGSEKKPQLAELVIERNTQTGELEVQVGETVIDRGILGRSTEPIYAQIGVDITKAGKATIISGRGGEVYSGNRPTQTIDYMAAKATPTDALASRPIIQPKTPPSQFADVTSAYSKLNTQLHVESFSFTTGFAQPRAVVPVQETGILGLFKPSGRSVSYIPSKDYFATAMEYVFNPTPAPVASIPANEVFQVGTVSFAPSSIVGTVSFAGRAHPRISIPSEAPTSSAINYALMQPEDDMVPMVEYFPTRVYTSDVWHGVPQVKWASLPLAKDNFAPAIDQTFKLHHTYGPATTSDLNLPTIAEDTGRVIKISSPTSTFEAPIKDAEWVSGFTRTMDRTGVTTTTYTQGLTGTPIGDPNVRFTVPVISQNTPATEVTGTVRGWLKPANVEAIPGVKITTIEYPIHARAEAVIGVSNLPGTTPPTQSILTVFERQPPIKLDIDYIAGANTNPQTFSPGFTRGVELPIQTVTYQKIFHIESIPLIDERFPMTYHGDEARGMARINWKGQGVTDTGTGMRQTFGSQTETGGGMVQLSEGVVVKPIQTQARAPYISITRAPPAEALTEFPAIAFAIGGGESVRAVIQPPTRYNVPDLTMPQVAPAMRVNPIDIPAVKPIQLERVTPSITPIERPIQMPAELTGPTIGERITPITTPITTPIDIVTPITIPIITPVVTPITTPTPPPLYPLPPPPLPKYRAAPLVGGTLIPFKRPRHINMPERERTMYADLFSMAASEAAYGSATSPSMTLHPELWAAEGGIGHVPTVEMLAARKGNKGRKGLDIFGEPSEGVKKLGRLI